MTKEQLKNQIAKLIVRNGWVEQNGAFYKSMPKKELKAYVNANGGFTKGKVETLAFDPSTVDVNDVPSGAFYFKAKLSDESINLNGYRILLSARSEGFQNYFNDYEGGVYLQHDMDQPIGKTLNIWVTADELFAEGFVYDDLTQNRISRGLVTDVSTGHIPLEVFYINDETQEKLTPSEFQDMLRDMVDDMYDNRNTRDEIKEAIADLQEKYIQTHTKVQIVEYSFVSVWANTNASVKTIRQNTLESLDTLEVELEGEYEVAEEQEDQEDTETNDTDDTQEDVKDTETNNDTNTGDDSLKIEGETPEAVEPTEPSENDAEVARLQAQVAELETNNKQLQEQIAELSVITPIKVQATDVQANEFTYKVDHSKVQQNVKKLLRG
jgi:hypothetical protein